MVYSPLKTLENHVLNGRDLYLYIRTVKSKGKRYRYLVIEEYLGNGKRKTLLSMPVEQAIEKLLWCGGWDLNPRRPTPSGPKPHAPFDTGSYTQLNFKQDGDKTITPSAEKLNAFYRYCRSRASKEVCSQYLRYLAKPLDKNNRWSITAYKKYYRWLCEEKNVEEACILFKKIKSKKSNADKYVPGLQEVLETIQKAEEPYRTVYKYLLYTGIRRNEVTYLLRNIDKLRKTRLDGFYRVELDLVRGTKKVFVAYMPELPEKIIISAKEVSEYARRNGLLAPKYVRKFVSTQMIKLGIPSDITDFITGHTPEKIITKHYLDLIALADVYYKKYADWLKNTGLI